MLIFLEKTLSKIFAGAKIQSQNMQSKANNNSITNDTSMILDTVDDVYILITNAFNLSLFRIIIVEIARSPRSWSRLYVMLEGCRDFDAFLMQKLQPQSLRQLSSKMFRMQNC